MSQSRQALAFDTPEKEQREIADTYAKLREMEAKLIGPDGKAETLPNNLYSFLLRLLADLYAGHPITILQNSHALTTIEASKVLGISRQYLVTLLERGDIPFHLTGTHRRIYVRDVMAYKARRDQSRHETLNDLARREYAEGIYDKVPDDFHAGK